MSGGRLSMLAEEGACGALACGWLTVCVGIWPAAARTPANAANAATITTAILRSAFFCWERMFGITCKSPRSARFQISPRYLDRFCPRQGCLAAKRIPSRTWAAKNQLSRFRAGTPSKEGAYDVSSRRFIYDRTTYGATRSLARGLTCAAARLDASQPPPSAFTSNTLVTRRCP
jgi:hypothetical protein